MYNGLVFNNMSGETNEILDTSKIELTGVTLGCQADAQHRGFAPIATTNFSHGFFVFFVCFVVSDVGFLVHLVFILSILSIHVCSVS